MRPGRCLVLLLVPALAGSVLRAQTAELAKLVPATGIIQGGYGQSVALQGDSAVVGWPTQARTQLFVHGPTGHWTEAAQFQGSTGFGMAVAMSGNRVLIGEPGLVFLTFFPGEAFIFDSDAAGTWSQSAHLEPSDGHPDDFFGEAVSLSGDRALIGAPDHGVFGS